MAKRRRRNPSKRRRRNPATVIVTRRANPRKRRRNPARRRNPTPTGLVKSAVSALVPATAATFVAGFVETKFLSGRGALVQVGSRIAMAALAGSILRRKPATAAAVMGALVGTVGHNMGVRAAGGAVVSPGRAGVGEIAALISEDQELLQGVHDEMEGMGLLSDRADVDLGEDLGAVDDVPDLGADEDEVSGIDEYDEAAA